MVGVPSRNFKHTRNTICINIPTNILTVYVDFHHVFFHKDLKRPHKCFKLAFLNGVFTFHQHLFVHHDRRELLNTSQGLLCLPFCFFCLEYERHIKEKECQYGLVIRKPKEILSDIENRTSRSSSTWVKLHKKIP